MHIKELPSLWVERTELLNRRDELRFREHHLRSVMAGESRIISSAEPEVTPEHATQTGSTPPLDGAHAAIELQPHHQIFYKNGMTDDGYCDLEQRLRAAGFRLLYRFPFVWEAWAREKDYGRLRRGLKREHII